MSEISNMASKGWFGFGGEYLEDKMVGEKEAKANAAQAADAQKQKEAEATVLAEQKAEETKKSKRASLMSQTTSGFGANTNLARSFLTSL